MNRCSDWRSCLTIALGFVAILSSIAVNSTIRHVLSQSSHTPSRSSGNANNATNAVIDEDDDPFQMMHRQLFPFMKNDYGAGAAHQHQQHYDASAYDYLIIQYHKTGHSASRRLTELIQANNKKIGFRKEVRSEPWRPRSHDPDTKCPHINLTLGQLNLQASPDFFCDLNVLAEELLHSNSNYNSNKAKRGIKIIHMVRNPYTMAISNYEYHRSDPTPESWVEGCFDLCESMNRGIAIDYPTLMGPTLSKHGIMEPNDWDTINGYCNALFQTHQGLETSDYYQHLRTLDQTEGLQLSTTKMMHTRAGDIVRMANNIIKLKELQQLETQYYMYRQHLVSSEKRIQVLTLTMDEFIQSPRDAAMTFLNFLLPMNNKDELMEVKENIANEYAQKYTSMVDKGDKHVTHHNQSDHDVLERSLREHDFFGRILSNIEGMVNDALAMNVYD